MPSIRDKKEKWNTIITTWVPHWGKRKRGRPPTRWVDDLKATVGPDWHKKAKKIAPVGKHWLGRLPKFGRFFEGVNSQNTDAAHLPTGIP